MTKQANASTLAVTESHAAAFTSDPKELEEARKNLSVRVCGSPAVDGYAHAPPKCLEESPTALWWKQYLAKGRRQEDLFAYVGEWASSLDIKICDSVQTWNNGLAVVATVIWTLGFGFLLMIYFYSQCREGC